GLGLCSRNSSRQAAAEDPSRFPGWFDGLWLRPQPSCSPVRIQHEGRVTVKK
ncbi:hypothetical protein L195_g048550, partial [Trifolium pratense]